MKNLLLLLALLFPLASQANRESGGRLGASAVYVYFSSFGTGIDSATASLAMELVQNEEMNGHVLAKTIDRRGREGEFLLCVQLANPTYRFQFIKDLAPSIRRDNQALPRQRTAVFVGLTCGNLEAATRQDINKY